MSDQRETGRRAPWDHWWVLMLSAAALIAVAIALVVSALGGGQARPAAHPVRAVPHAQATASATPTTGATPTTAPSAVPGSAGRVHYTGATSGTAAFASAACIIGDGSVAEVQAPAPGSGTSATLSMTRAAGGLSVLLSGKYLHSGATPGVTVQHGVSGWSVQLKNVTLADNTGGTVTVNGAVVCTATNVPG